jgi:hypothetical protein
VVDPTTLSAAATVAAGVIIPVVGWYRKRANRADRERHELAERVDQMSAKVDWLVWRYEQDNPEVDGVPFDGIASDGGEPSDGD